MYRVRYADIAIDPNCKFKIRPSTCAVLLACLALASCGGTIHASQFVHKPSAGLKDVIVVNIYPKSPFGGSAPLTVRPTGIYSYTVGFTINTWAWDFGDQTSCIHSAAPNVPPTQDVFNNTGSPCFLNPTHSYAGAGSFELKFTVTDTAGTIVTASTPVTVTSPLATCPATNPMLGMKAGVDYYALPAWITALNFIQPADVLYGGNQWNHITRTYGLHMDPATYANVEPYCSWVMADGGKPPYTFAVRNAPPGLTLNPVTGFYGGVATEPGFYGNVLFSVTDAAGTTVSLLPRSQNVCLQGLVCPLPVLKVPPPPRSVAHR